MFSGQNINFGGRFRFHFDGGSGELIVSNNPQYIENFFEPSGRKTEDAKITQITALVGQNGAGKTSFFDFIKENLIEGVSGTYHSMLLCISDNNDVVFYQIGEVGLVKHNLKDHGISYKKEGLTKLTEKSPSIYSKRIDVKAFNKVHFIYLSNVFDNNPDTELVGLKDLSTNFLTRNDRDKGIEFQSRSVESSDSFQAYTYDELQRQIEFVQYFKDIEVIPFTLPDTLRATLRNVHTMFSDDESNLLKESGLDTLADALFNCWQKDKEWKPELIKDITISHFLYKALINYLIELTFAIKSAKKLGEIDFSLHEVPELATLLDYTDWMDSEFRRLGLSVFPDRLIEIPLNIRELVSKLEVVIEDDQQYLLQNESTSFTIKTLRDTFEQFYPDYRRSYFQRPYVNFSWRKISSGEKALINIFARLFTLSDSSPDSTIDSLRESVILMIDEGDLYLHPEWQRQLVYLITTFLSKAYKRVGDNPRTIQIIFSTNSPIPISDIPNSSVIFLQKNGEKVIVRDSLEDKKMTFGANIHTLLADSFFLQNGLVGNFAKNKINEIIEILQGSRKVILEKRDYIETVISLIGEPLIRTKLVQMMTERLQMNMMDLDTRVKKLEHEIETLKKNR